MSLIAHFPLTGNINDYSGNNIEVTTSGVTISSNGKIGQSYNFADNTYIRTSSNQTLRGDVSFAIWIYPTSDVGIGGLISNHNHGAPSNFTMSRRSDKKIHIDGGYTDGTRSYGINSIGTTPLNEWSHVAFTYNYNSNNMKVYINGILDNSIILSKTPYFTDYPILIGQWAGSYLNNYEFYGQLNDVRIYDHTLTEREVKELSRAKVLHYKFDEFVEPTKNWMSSPREDGYAYSGTGYGFLSQSWTWSELGVADGESVTLSALMKIDKVRKDAGGRVTMYIYTRNPGDSWGASTQISSTSLDYEKYERTLTRDDSYLLGDGNPSTDVIVSFYHMPSTIDAGTSYVKKIQFETKDYSTEFVVGTRDYGIINDNSGQGNDGVVNLATTPEWTEDSKIGNGAYNFESDNENISNPDFNIGTNPIFTVSGWFKRTGTWQAAGLWGIGSRNNAISSYQSYATDRVGFDEWGSTTYYTSEIIPLNEWTHIVWVKRDEGQFKSTSLDIYINGNKATLNTIRDGNVSANIDTGISIGRIARDYANYGVMACIQDIRIYATVLSQDDINDLYKQRLNIDISGDFNAQTFDESGIDEYNNLIRYEVWEKGSYTASKSFTHPMLSGSMDINANSNYTNIIDDFINPIDEVDTMIKFESNSLHYQQYAHPTTYYRFTINPNRTYRFTQWIYCHEEPSSSSNQRNYVGMSDSVCNVNTTTANTNPYFTAPSMGDTNYLGKWVLWEFFIYPYGTTGNPTSGKGYYTDGTYFNVGRNFNWMSNASSVYVRQYPMYEYGEIGDGTYVKHYRPRFEVVNGNELPIEAIIGCGEHRPISSGELNIIELKSSGVNYSNGYSEVGITNGLVGWWKLDGNTDDYSLGNNDGTNDGATITSGLGQQAYDLDGSGTSDGTVYGGNILIPELITNTSTSNYPSGCTYSIWIKVDANAVDRMSLFRGSSTIRHIEIYSDGKNFRTEAALQNGYTFGSGAFPDDVKGVWSHFTIVFANNESERPVRWYQNGNLFHTGYMSRGANPDTEYFSFSSIGRSTGGASYPYAKSFNGKVQDFRIYDRVLSEKEISINYRITNPNNGEKVIQDNNILYIKGELSEVNI